METPSELFATVCFALALIHTFLVKQFQHMALKYREGSPGENIFHLLGEVEVVFGLWAGVYLLWVTFYEGHANTVSYLDGLNFTEPVFVFVIMVVCASKPILFVANRAIQILASRLPFNAGVSFFVTTLIVGPLLGSFITEPAAMTVTALLLLNNLYEKKISPALSYATIGLLFVNISIGGTLTPYAAPPVLMVASKWGWDLQFMFTHFGWKAILAVSLSTALTAFRFRDELSKISFQEDLKPTPLPSWVVLFHLFVLVLVVMNSHHLAVFALLFLFFLGLAKVTEEYQSDLHLREGLLVGFFLAGLVILGGPQRWWLEPIISRLGSISLYLSATALTAVTDNAALTYLGSQVPSLSEVSRYALVAGSVVGGGLTVIANAPNPVGYGTLNASFGPEGISPLKLLASAAIPTAIASICFWPY